MQGFYLMSQDNGEQLKVDIPAFSLDSPYNKKIFINLNVKLETHSTCRWSNYMFSWFFIIDPFNC